MRRGGWRRGRRGCPTAVLRGKSGRSGLHVQPAAAPADSAGRNCRSSVRPLRRVRSVWPAFPRQVERFARGKLHPGAARLYDSIRARRVRVNVAGRGDEFRPSRFSSARADCGHGVRLFELRFQIQNRRAGRPKSRALIQRAEEIRPSSFACRFWAGRADRSARRRPAGFGFPCPNRNTVHAPRVG